MLAKVPMDNDLITAYGSFPSFGIRPILAELQYIIDAGDNSKKGGKRKAKASSSEVQATNVQHHEMEDTTHTLEPLTLEPTMKVTSLTSSCAPTSDIFYSIIQE